MFAPRIDDFDGDDRAYAGYLLEVLTQILPKCILQLEEQVKEARCGSNAPLVRVVLEFKDPTPPPGLQAEILDSAKQTPSSGHSKPAEGDVTDSFFESLPKTEEQWLETRKSARLSSAEDVVFAVNCLATGRLNTKITFTDHTSMPDLQDSLTTFARNVGKAMRWGNFCSNISSFLSLIFVATCCVATTRGHSMDSVDDAQRELIMANSGKCDKESRSLANDRAAVKWLLLEMQRQFRRGLGQRAFELFLISKCIALRLTSRLTRL